MSKRHICLSMIVKNEAAVIRRCLASVLPIIDSWVICSTGSTDGTQETIRDFFALSLYRSAKLKAQLGHHSDDVIDAFAAAARIDARRMEALHGAARYCREHERYQEEYDVAKRALNVWPRPPTEALFHEQWIYDYGALDEYCVCASQIGQYEDSLPACRRLLEAGRSVPAEDRQRMEANARFASQKIAEKGSPHRKVCCQ